MPSQSLQPPSLTGLTAPLTQEDGWRRRGRRRDDDDATTSTGGRDGAESFGAESGDGGPDGGPLGAVRAGHCFLDWLVVEEVTQLDVGLWADIAGQAGAVPTAPRLQAAARGAGRLRRGAGAPHARVTAAPDLAGGFLHELTENQRSDQKIFPFLEWLRVGEAEQVELRDAVRGAGVPEAWGRTRAW